MEPTPRSLYGGKVTVDLPAAWTDMADQRPVPDHQEVYCEPDGGLGRNVIFEIVERAATSDRLAAQYFFNDVAEAGGASMRELLADEAWDEAAASSGATFCCAARGYMMLTKTEAVGTHQVDVGLIAFRFEADRSDLLVTVNAPRTPGAQPDSFAFAKLMPAIARSLRVDTSLFRGEPIDAIE